MAMSSSWHRAMTAAILLACAAAAQAADTEAKPKADAAPRAEVATFGQLDALRSQNALLEAQAKNDELRRKLAGGGNSASTQAAGGAQSPVAQVLQAQAAAKARVHAAPAPAPAPVTAEVELVESDAKGQMVAVLSLKNGRKAMKVRVGSEVPGLGTITSISVDEVTVAGKKGQVSLPFAVEVVGGASGTSGVGMPMSTMPTMSTMPLMPPMPTTPNISTVMPPIPSMPGGSR